MNALKADDDNLHFNHIMVSKLREALKTEDKTFQFNHIIHSVFRNALKTQYDKLYFSHIILSESLNLGTATTKHPEGLSGSCSHRSLVQNSFFHDFVRVILTQTINLSPSNFPTPRKTLCFPLGKIN